MVHHNLRFASLGFNLSSEIGIALLGTGLGLGLRHGIDWDHIAAISDVTSSQSNHRRSLLMGTLYALGHAAIVIALGLLAIWFGTLLPEWVDGYMEAAVGITLLILGVWLIWSMAKNNGRLVMRSRWMLVFDLVKSSYRKINPNKPKSIYDEACILLMASCAIFTWPFVPLIIHVGSLFEMFMDAPVFSCKLRMVDPRGPMI